MYSLIEHQTGIESCELPRASCRSSGSPHVPAKLFPFEREAFVQPPVFVSTSSCCGWTPTVSPSKLRFYCTSNNGSQYVHQLQRTDPITWSIPNPKNPSIWSITWSGKEEIFRFAGLSEDSDTRKDGSRDGRCWSKPYGGDGRVNRGCRCSTIRLLTLLGGFRLWKTQLKPPGISLLHLESQTYRTISSSQTLTCKYVMPEIFSWWISLSNGFHVFLGLKTLVRRCF